MGLLFFVKQQAYAPRASHSKAQHSTASRKTLKRSGGARCCHAMVEMNKMSKGPVRS
jgi:hypothetical protein